MGLVQFFSQISRIDNTVLETGGWNKKNKKDYASWTSAANIVTLMTVTKAVTEASIKWVYSISQSKR